MSAIDVLRDPRAAPSSVWLAVEKLLGPHARIYETETLEIELGRLGVEWSPALAAKVLGAQTILVSRAWTYEYAVLFAFACATSGVPADSAASTHPEVCDLAWAMKEIQEITGHPPDDDHGFDQDRVDPAIAAVLHHDGWVLAPGPLAFSQKALDRLTGEHSASLRELVADRWSSLEKAPEADGRKVFTEVPESALKVQLEHLYGCHLELVARARLREEHRRAI